MKKKIKKSKKKKMNQIKIEQQQKEIMDLKNEMKIQNHKNSTIIQQQQREIENLRFESDLKTFDNEIYNNAVEINHLTFQHRLLAYEYEMKDKKQQEVIKILEHCNLKLQQEIAVLKQDNLK